MKARFFSIIGLGVASALVSCIPLKATVVRELAVTRAIVVTADAPKGEPQGWAFWKKPKENPKQKPKPMERADSPPPPRGESVRLPNMLGLPGEKDLKATNPSVPKSGKDDGPVISRPPVEKR